ncbi:MAG: winged helix-turn-helix domain-containing protein [Tsuneonella sp.]
MTAAGYRFGDCHLDPAERRLERGGEVLDVSGRYLDALELLVREQGSLVTKDRFMDEVWRGVPVTDEALTQCVRALRKALGDDAARPRFIETVPKHGYRFIAPVKAGERGHAAPTAAVDAKWHAPGLLAVGGTLGACIAGSIAGLLYGFVAAQSAPADGAAASTLIVVLLVTVALAFAGGAAVSCGIAAARTLFARGALATVTGGAAGGLAIGAVFRLFGLDAFNLLLGRAPDGVTGPGEGVLLGAAAGLAAWIALRRPEPRGLMRRTLTGGWIGAAAGAIIVALGGRLLGGSLALLAARFPGSRLRLDALGRMLGEGHYGAVSQLVTGAAEGALFVGCIAAGFALAARRTARS